MRRILDAYPAVASARPGEPAAFRLELDHDGRADPGWLSVRLRDNGNEMAYAEVKVQITPGHNILQVEVPVPDQDAYGYEALLELVLEDGEHCHARTALLVASHWRLAPRYGFLSEFPPGDPATDRVRELAKFHVTVVQFYDWMYRHYRFLPPQDDFTDAMERCLSRATVAERVYACHEAGMAALAYGAVYGAEPEFIDDHPDWVLRDAHDQPLSLIDLFYITDLRPGSPWREHVLGEFESAVTELAFDGIHMDQYGFPKWAYDASGAAVDLAGCFPGLIDEAAERVASRRGGAAVLFNAVNNWPVERVARTKQAAVYIEVWSPHDQYRDLVNVIRRARDLSGKQVVLAAYLESFKDGGVAAEASALLATAVIASAGGHHLLLGEGHAALQDPYYPNHAVLAPEFVPIMRRYYDHTAALHAYLYPSDLVDVTNAFTLGINKELALCGAKVSATPEAGCAWITVKQRGAQLVINLVNLVGVGTATWNTGKEQPEPLSDLILKVGDFANVRRVSWSSPDEDAPIRELQPVPISEGGTSIPLPQLTVWATLVLDLV
ncbi:MAG TPA: glycoside hydrolase family 66 protein [Trueperaceae bacterium]